MLDALEEEVRRLYENLPQAQPADVEREKAYVWPVWLVRFRHADVCFIEGTS